MCTVLTWPSLCPCLKAGSPSRRFSPIANSFAIRLNAMVKIESVRSSDRQHPVPPTCVQPSRLTISAATRWPDKPVHLETTRGCETVETTDRRLHGTGRRELLNLQSGFL